MAEYVNEKAKTDISQYFDTLIFEKADWIEPNLENIKNTVLRILDNTPNADVVKVRHGKWIEHHGQSYLVHPMKYDEYGPILQDYVSYECSECGRTESKKEPYCHCGAKMDRKEDEGK